VFYLRFSIAQASARPDLAAVEIASMARSALHRPLHVE
jgi:hypothetical protein